MSDYSDSDGKPGNDSHGDFLRLLPTSSNEDIKENVHSNECAFLTCLSSTIGPDRKVDKDALDMNWMRELTVEYDITKRKQRVEHWRMEIDWGVLTRIAQKCGLTWEEKDSVPLPVLMQDRYGQKEFQCLGMTDSSFFTHRTENIHLASMLATHLLLVLGESDDRITKDYEEWRKVFAFGGNFSYTESIAQLNRQQAAYEQLMEHTTALPYANNDILYATILDYLNHSKESYPLFVFVPAKKSGRQTITLEVRGYGEPTEHNSAYGVTHLADLGRRGQWSELRNRAKDKFRNKSDQLMGISRIQYANTWLRGSAFTKIQFPKDCRAIIDPRHANSKFKSEFCDGTLFSSIHWDGHGPEPRLSYWAIPRLRAVGRLALPTILQIIILYLYALIWRLWPIEHLAHSAWLSGSSGTGRIPLAVFITLLTAQFGITYMWADMDESPLLTRVLRWPRRLLRWSAILDIILSITFAFHPGQKEGLTLQSTASGTPIPQSLFLCGILLLASALPWVISFTINHRRAVHNERT